MFKFLKEKLQNIFKSEKPSEELQEEEKVEEKIKEEKKEIKQKKSIKKKEISIKEKPEIKEEIGETENLSQAIEEAIEVIKEEEVKKQSKEVEIEKPVEEKRGFFNIFKRKKPEEIEELNPSEEKETDKQNIISKIQGKFNLIKIDKTKFNEIFEKLEMVMLESNVALEVVDKIREDLEKSLLDAEIKRSDLENEIKNTLKKSLNEILIEPFNLLEKIKNKSSSPFVILFFGINGAGKTTTIAKIADLLQRNNITCVLAAADTFRAASIEQLQKHGEKLDVKVIHQDYGSDPSAVAFDAIKYAESHGIKAVLIDTAGRMHTKDNLLKEMEKIVRVTKPDLKIFVAESITGNDATEQAKNFNETAGIDGTILSKADVDEKGGTAISIGYVTKKPILYLGIGQEYNDLEVFSPKKILNQIGLE